LDAVAAHVLPNNIFAFELDRHAAATCAENYSKSMHVTAKFIEVGGHCQRQLFCLGLHRRKTPRENRMSANFTTSVFVIAQGAFNPCGRASSSSFRRNPTLSDFVFWREERRCQWSTRSVVEYFAGEGRLTKACCDLGMNSSRWDKAYDVSHDVLSELGLRTWLDEHAHSAVGCLVWFGTQCSSFLLICKSVSMRMESNDYFGDVSREFVKSGNALMQITALLYFLAWLTDCRPVIEQPVQSCLFKLKPLSTVMKMTCAIRR
jgi:hypothetical protein